MQRRTFLQQIAFSIAAVPVARLAAAQEHRAPIILQQSPLAGYQHHAGTIIWSTLTIGAVINLKREPENPHDKRAIAVYAGPHKLGYLPRVENTAAAYLLDSGHKLSARITRLKESQNPWERVRMEIMLKQ